MMFKTLDDKYLEILLKYLKLNEQKFDKDKLRYYYHYTTQYYIKKINNGQDKYKKDVVNIYKLMREKDLFLIDNIITDQEFSNVSNMALSLKEYNWLDSFLEEYGIYIDPLFAEDAYNLAKAKLAFHKKDLDNAFIYLNKIGLSDTNYYTNSKYLLGRLHFDTNNIEGVRYIIENLRQYLRSKKNLTPEQTDAIKTYIKYLPELIRLIECKNTKEKKSQKLILSKQLDNEKKLVPNKGWFYEKLEEIK